MLFCGDFSVVSRIKRFFLPNSFVGKILIRIINRTRLLFDWLFRHLVAHICKVLYCNYTIDLPVPLLNVTQPPTTIRDIIAKFTQNQPNWVTSLIIMTFRQWFSNALASCGAKDLFEFQEKVEFWAWGIFWPLPVLYKCISTVLSSLSDVLPAFSFFIEIFYGRPLTKNFW